MKIIEKIYIEKFRAFENLTINFNKPVNAIIGRNGTLKTTLLGMLAHPFSLETGSMSQEIPLIGGRKFNSPMSDKFKFSDIYDVPGEHKWSLYVNKKIYEKEIYTCISEKRKDNGKIRFWSTEGRQKGMNYIQCPVIYLSMKRLMPVGEEKKLQICSAELTEEEKNFYIEMHNKILISTEIINDVSSVNSSNKHSLGPVTNKSDAWTISAGQDNIGRIILAVLSMKRLQEKYQEEYKGGIICVDELESTLYPAAQEKLLDFMFETAREYKLQYFFTTHSMSVIDYLKTGKYTGREMIVCLQKIGGKIKVTENPSLKNIENDLNVSAGRRAKSPNIKVYCEDDVGVMFTKTFLNKDIKSHVDFVTKMDLSWTAYKTLYDHKVPEFLNNIIVLDGDVKDPKLGWKKYPTNTNVLFLPTEYAPERMIYEMLFGLDDMDTFWNNELGEYSRDVCFRDYPNYTEDIDAIKKWFKSQKEFAGRGYSKFLNLWKRKNPELVDQFQSDFIHAYNYLAKKIGDKQI